MKKRDDRGGLGNFWENRPTPDSYYASETRYFSAHHLLLETARKAAKSKSKNLSAQRQSSVIAILMSAISIEAFINAAGHRLVTDWIEFDRLQPWPKLLLIGQAINLNLDAGRQPWQDIRWLIRLRNEIAHAKPQDIQTLRWHTADQARAWAEKEDVPVPESDLERELVLDNARRAVTAVDQVVTLIMDAIPTDDKMALLHDGWMSGAYEVPPDEPKDDV